MQLNPRTDIMRTHIIFPHRCCKYSITFTADTEHSFVFCLFVFFFGISGSLIRNVLEWNNISCSCHYFISLNCYFTLCCQPQQPISTELPTAQIQITKPTDVCAVPHNQSIMEDANHCITRLTTNITNTEQFQTFLDLVFISEAHLYSSCVKCPTQIAK